MKKKSIETQENIINAARDVFVQKGFAGARMQEIADRAGINKALLHYYYRSKEKLFEQVFEEAMKLLFRPLGTFFADDSELFDKIRNISRLYAEVMTAHPFIPNFVISEINTDPSRILKMMDMEGVLKGRNKTFEQIDNAVKAGKIKPIDPRELILNIISLIVYPILVRPLVTEFLFEGDDIDQIYETRADRVADFIIQSIKI